MVHYHPTVFILNEYSKPAVMVPGNRAAKSRFWVKVLFLDQISSRPCQPDMSLGFILSMIFYSDGHCTKQPCKSDSLSRLIIDVVQYFNIGH